MLLRTRNSSVRHLKVASSLEGKSAAVVLMYPHLLHAYLGQTESGGGLKSVVRRLKEGQPGPQSTDKSKECR